MRRVSRAQYNAILARRQMMSNNGEEEFISPSGVPSTQQGNIAMQIVVETQSQQTTIQSQIPGSSATISIG